MFNFNSFWNADPSVYEAIIAALIVVGLIQTVAFRRVGVRYKKVLRLAGRAVIGLSSEATRTVLALQAELSALRQELDNARREAMEVAADLDDTETELESLRMQPVVNGQGRTFVSKDPNASFEAIFGAGSRGGHVASFRLGPNGIEPLDEVSASFGRRHDIESILGSVLGGGEAPSAHDRTGAAPDTETAVRNAAFDPFSHQSPRAG